MPSAARGGHASALSRLAGGRGRPGWLDLLHHASNLSGEHAGCLRADHHASAEFIAALLSIKTIRPVKLVYTREENTMCTRQGHSMIAHIKTGVDQNGVVLARDLTVTAPNLRVASTNSPTSAGWGETFSVSWIVQNDGDGQAFSAWSDKVFLSQDATLDAGDTLLDTYDASGHLPLAAACLLEAVL